ncbi:Na+/H+-dicarboxylate symporter [Lachnospiraceae bacterium NE2001]|nr:Na+/H+-dicarboxylate symporter [Lachnospiraceae bacterium NE2001]
MRSKKDIIEIHNMQDDFEQSREFVEQILKKERASDNIRNETLLVFESILTDIFEQRKKFDSPITVRTEKKWGSTRIRIGYEDEMYSPKSCDGSDPSPEERILKAYNDRIDYSFLSGYNNIGITIKHSRGTTLMPCILGIILAIITYTIFHLVLKKKEELFVLNEVVFPIEKWCGNLLLMIGTPVTFISFLKNLTDAYIVYDRHSDVKKIRRGVFTSSILAVLLALITGWLIFQVIHDPQIEYENPMSIDKSIPELLETLIPADIVTPFMTLSPFPLLILAALVTFALCSVGKYFDKMKNAIDTAYALFSRMLTIVMYGLPLYVFLAFLDLLLDVGYSVLLLVLELSLAIAASMIVMIIFYWIRLIIGRVPVWPFVRKLGPLMRENYRISSALDAAPFNIRYCARTWHMDRKKLEINIPVLAEINLDGNCFFVTLIPLVLMFSSNAEVSLLDMLLIGILVFFLSLGAPNQPGSVLIGLLIVLSFMQSSELISTAFICEVFFGGLLNLVNVIGDIVTVAVMEKENISTTQ